MYFNPTVPHASNDVAAAITSFDCTQVGDPNKAWDSDPWIKGMSEDAGCDAYRDSIVSRSQTTADMGKIWVDDAVGALLEALRDANVLDDTIFLFQEDHGMDSKGGVYEGGIRIPQFIHYPAEISPSTQFNGLVSTIDIAATMLDYAGITPPYEMDGKSWKSAIGNSAEELVWEYDRCLFFEIDRDRAVRCGCYKFIDIYSTSSPTYERGGTTGRRAGGQANDVGGMLFDLCGGGSDYITARANSQEEDTVTNASELNKLTGALDCYLAKSDPDDSADYSICPEDAITTAPQAAPTDAPQAAPTDAPQASCQDSPFTAIVGGNSRTCTWIANNGSRCSKRRFWAHCHQSCNACDQCRDSNINFQYNGNTVKCNDGVTSAMCSDADIAATCPRVCGTCW